MLSPSSARTPAANIVAVPNIMPKLNTANGKANAPAPIAEEDNVNTDPRIEPGAMGPNVLCLHERLWVRRGSSLSFSYEFLFSIIFTDK